MANFKKEWVSIVSGLNTNTKILGLVCLIAEAFFLSSLPFISGDDLLQVFYFCAAILIVTIVGIVIIQITEIKSSSNNRLTPSPLTPRSEFLDELVNSAIQTVCRAISLPSTPQSADLRVFVFIKENNQLVCSHFWSQDPVVEQVGKLKFDLTLDISREIAVVRSALNESICRTSVGPISSPLKEVTGEVDDNLQFVLASPIIDSMGVLRGVVDFDTTTNSGKSLLSTVVSDAVMYQLAKHLSVIFSLEHKAKGIYLDNMSGH